MGPRPAALIASGACLALAACGGGTSSTAPTDAEQITQVIETAVTTTDPSICDQLLTSDLVNRLGGPSQCHDAVAANTATSVSVTEIQISPSGKTAKAIVEPLDGDDAGTRYSDTLVSQGGEWRISATHVLGT